MSAENTNKSEKALYASNFHAKAIVNRLTSRPHLEDREGYYDVIADEKQMVDIVENYLDRILADVQINIQSRSPRDVAEKFATWIEQHPNEDYRLDEIHEFTNSLDRDELLRIMEFVLFFNDINLQA